VQAAQQAVRRRHSSQGLAQSLRVLGLAQMPDYGPALPALDLPVRLVVGALDEKFGLLAARAAARLPRAEVVRVPGVGHNVLLEAPDALCALL
jgi:2-succinyl-6-hydroxy-2,4-cyclohexadiene-1-carboxylate synthase